MSASEDQVAHEAAAPSHWPACCRSRKNSAVRQNLSPCSPCAIDRNPINERDWRPFMVFFTNCAGLGCVEGDNLAVMRFSAQGATSRYDELATDVVSASPDLIFAINNPLVLRFKALVQSVPIVALMGDPIAWGIVSNLLVGLET